MAAVDPAMIEFRFSHDDSIIAVSESEYGKKRSGHFT